MRCDSYFLLFALALGWLSPRVFGDLMAPRTIREHHRVSAASAHRALQLKPTEVFRPRSVVEGGWRKSPVISSYPQQYRIHTSRSNVLQAKAVKTEAPSSIPPQLRDRLILLATGALYALVTIDIRNLALQEGGPSVSLLSAMRGCVIALCMAPAAAQLLSKGKNPSASQWLTSLEMAIYNLGSQGLFAAGVYITDASLAAFLTQASIIVTPIIAASTGEKVSKWNWAGGAVALAGIGLLGLSQQTTGVDSGGSLEQSLTGPLLCLGGAVSWSLYICRYKKILEDTNDGMSPAALQTWKSALLALLYILFFALDVFKGTTTTTSGGEEATLQLGEFLQTAWPAKSDATQWGAIVFSGAGVALAHYLQGLGQKTISSSEANIYLGSEPLWTAAFAYFLLNEHLQGAGGYAGAGLLVLAALLSSGFLESKLAAPQILEDEVGGGGGEGGGK